MRAFRMTWPRGARAAALLLAVSFAAPAQAASPFEDAMNIVEDPARLAKDAAAAEKKFQEAAKANPKNAHAWYNLGLLARRRGDWAAAGKAFESALAADPKYLAARARLAERDLRAGKTAAAVAALEKLVEEDRFQAEARNILAELAIEKKDWPGAIRHARNVLLGNPDNVNAYLNLAIAYYRQNLVDQAGLIVTNALERNPKAAALHNMFGLIYLKKDDSRNATKSFQTALEVDPDNLDARINLATLELAYGDFESALKRLDEVLKLRPNDPKLVMTRAVALRGLKKFDEAELGYLQVLKLDPSMTEAEYNLCVLHAQYSNKWLEARKYCQGYAGRLTKKDAKYKELTRRVKSIESTIKALDLDKPAAPPGGQDGAQGGAKPPTGK